MPIYTIHIIRIHDNIEESFNALHPCHRAFCEAMAQEMASGIVLDAETKEPLIGAVIATADGKRLFRT